MHPIALPALAVWAVTILVLLALAIRGAIPRGRQRRTRLKVLARALLPGRILRSRSGRLDIAGFLFSTVLAGSALGWGLVSADWWMQVTGAVIGPARGVALLPGWIAAPLVTIALFVAYEAAYWFDHKLSHRVPALWAFHKVHHSAESLSLLTNFRVHPVDTLVFYNIAALSTGVTGALLARLIGPAGQWTVGSSNAIVFVTSILLSFLQHSHLWLALPGRWGAVLLSPAHHQLHHSVDPQHHGRNFGSTLALFDSAAGTLLRPTAARQRLSFGVQGSHHDPHGFGGAVVRPFVEAGRSLVPERAPASQATVVRRAA